MGPINIPLHANDQNTTPTADPVQGFADAYKIKDLMLQPQLRQQQIQQNQIQLDQERQTIADQDHLRQSLIQSNYDLDKVPSIYLARGGSMRTLTQFQKDQAARAQSFAKATKLQNENQKAKEDALAGAHDAFSKLPDDEKMNGWNAHLDRQQSRGVLTPEERATYPTTYPGDSALQARIMEHRFDSANIANSIKDRTTAATESRAQSAATTAEIRKKESEAKAPGIQADAEGKERANWSAKLETAALQGEDAYVQTYHQMPPALQSQVPVPQEFDEDETPDKVRRWGQTAEQRTKSDLEEARVQRQQTMDADTMRHRKVLESEGWARIQSRKDQTKNSKAIDIRRANTDIAKAMKDEEGLNDLRRGLGNAIASGGKIYVDRLGNRVPMAKATQADNSSADVLLQDMKDRFRGVSEQLGATLRAKYAAAERIEMQPKVSLDQALADIADGTEKTLGGAKSGAPAAAGSKPATPPAAAAPPAPAPRATPGKPKPRISRADAMAKAKAANKDVNAYIQALESHGYEVFK